MRGSAGALARPSRTRFDESHLLPRLSHFLALFIAVFFTIAVLHQTASAETRPHYGGTLRLMLQSAPISLDLPANATPTEYWDAKRTLSLIGDTLIKLDPLDHPRPALAVDWHSDTSARGWQFILRRGVKFHDGTPASAAAIAQILGALHPSWTVRSSADSLAIESDTPLPNLLAELALPRNLILKHNANGLPIGTGPFVVAEWQPTKLLKLSANDENWAGRPFVDAVEIEFGKSLRDQAIALDLGKTDIIAATPQSPIAGQPHHISTSVSLSVELLALVFTSNSKAQDPRLREALALAIDRAPIQSVLLKGAGEPASSILPDWMTGYSHLFSLPANPQRARSLIAASRLPALNLSYDPTDPHAQLIAERIALNAREIGITLHVSLSVPEDIRLACVVLPGPDPATSLAEATRQLGLSLRPFSPAPGGNELDDLYLAERNLLDGYTIIPLFHLPVAALASSRVYGWGLNPMADWGDLGHSLADVWLEDRAPSPHGEEPSR